MEVFRGKVLECLQLTPKWFSQCMRVCIYTYTYIYICTHIYILIYRQNNYGKISTNAESRW